MIEKLKQNKELWNLFTRSEEYNPLMLDRHERFLYHLSEDRNIFEPKVSQFLIENGLKVEYPEEKKFAVCLTHDIDVLNFLKLDAFCSSLSPLIHGQIKNAFEILFYPFNKKLNPLWNFKDIIALEKKYNAKSSFYIMTADKGDLDFNYNVADLEFELGYIIDSDCEIGLHGSRIAYNNFLEIRKEKEKLEKVLGKGVIGYRNHYLMFKVPDSWELLSKVGFKYDTTLGYTDCVGFRNGMCHPFKPFNLDTNKEIDIFEIPLTIMDSTLYDYMRLDTVKSWEIIKLLIDTVEKYNGIITILWHNTNMVDDNLKLYEKILKYCHQKNAWMTSGEHLWRWWTKNFNYI